MQINDKDAGAYLKVVSGGGARGVAAGAGDATEAVGAIVDQLANEGLRSGLIFVAGSATLAEDKVIALSVKIEHGDVANLSDKADFITAVVFAAAATGGSGGSTETFDEKVNVDLWGIKRYWRASVTPDCDAASADVFQLGFGVAAIGESAPLT